MSEPTMHDLERRLDEMGRELYLGRLALAQAEPMIDRLKAELPRMLADLQTQAKQITDLRGQRDVLLQLLRDAADVLHTVVGADADEDRRLRELRDLIADACGGVMLAMVQEAHQAEPLINQCGETCERAKLCAVCASNLAEQDDDLTAAWMAGAAEERKRAEQPQPAYWGVFEGGNLHDFFTMRETAEEMAYYKGSHAVVGPIYTTPPAPIVPQPLTIERLRYALVASRIIDPGAVEDPDNYDDGVTLARIEALYRRIT